eukprot:CAMPEP_0182854452 /NCGR_PEP_ID=MMETSP0034_2-20130328/1259_1 /TAXON_ID=156128 /ORGANISM="Nephroselmis pyriformis, Strain CCMP717" /LENGTH=202 /DNA_ID=CAMNT_0024985285 /DNA_START=140 /DNA_END=744 /DNA_ORIENTATION=-
MSFGPVKKQQPGGGLTKETQHLLQGLMKERGMSNRLRDDIMSSVASGDPLPASNFASGRASMRARKNPPVNVPRPKTKKPPPSMPGSFSGKKMVKEIMRDNPLDEQRDNFKPKPGRDNDREKEKLNLLMETANLEPETRDARMQARFGPRPEPVKKAFVKRMTAAEEREQLVEKILDEIEEREQFLEDMEKLGRGTMYQAQV